ncbi:MULTISPECIES: lysozyme [unclassified Marinobacterium]|uniref:lysozyme n=2 Tax=Marinobacterium TaxID=48075 RepID=UPI0019D8378D|nr:MULTISPECIES: lysozyme [unclassified Marinobacterium]NRP53829.1 Lysozyme RrrD [Marinobacterium sp. xm-v-242]NRP84099.1 Lysozyme RrrD [Marinobacterium sp. xm-d-509]
MNDLLKALKALLKSRQMPKKGETPKKPTRVERIDLIKKHEGLRLKAYLPTPYDVWTIGYGHTKTAYEGLVITERQAEKLLRQDLKWVRDNIAKEVKVPLTQPQYDALASFIFNLGGANFRTSTLLRKLNAYDYVGAADEFLRWNKQRQGGQMVVLRGLTKRREEERALFLEGTDK